MPNPEISSPSIEQRLRAIEDRFEIYNLIAAHPPSVDGDVDDYVAGVWTEDGVFDRGEGLSSHRGRTGIGASSTRPGRAEAIKAGLCHFAGLPYVTLNGDTAIVTSYLQVLVRETQGEPVAVPNHGTSKGHRVHRLVTNRWELVRRDGRWLIKSRKLRLMDGAEPARQILKDAFADTAA
jgi:hypothetical protein